MNINIKTWIGCSLMLYPAFAGATTCYQQPQNVTTVKPVESKYEQLFGNMQKAKGGFMTLLKNGSKVYAQIPLSDLGKRVLYGVTISQVSDPSVIAAGMKPVAPIVLNFVKYADNIRVESDNSKFVVDKTSNINKSIALNYNPGVYMQTPIVAYTPDSTAVVFDITNFVVNDQSPLSVLPKMVGGKPLNAMPKGNATFVNGIKAFDNNASVSTEYNYNVSIGNMKETPFSVNVTYTFLLLPEKKMQPRLADVRMGYFSSGYMHLSDDNKIEPIYYIHRWRIEPKDKSKWMKGELTPPVKPIVFYVDSTFPEAWKKPIKKGVLAWNKAFEKIGFKNVIQVKDFPKNDSIFDADNLNYNCIRYIPNREENSMGPSWVDPATGEIINASVYLYNNLAELLRKWRFVQTANVDPEMRKGVLPPHKFAESLAYATSHEVGHTLGLMHNMKASSAFPTDSLRSASFTQKYGVAPSIMDYARFNYVAQPQDKGVKLTAPELGVYDYFAIEWGYKPYLNAKTIEEDAKCCNRLLEMHQNDKMLRYSNTQSLDPRAKSEDLGDDPIKSGDYAIKNLLSIKQHLGEWIKPETDEDGQRKKVLSQEIANQYARLVGFVINEIGGIYLDPTTESSGKPRYAAVDKNTQKTAVKWVVQRIKEAAALGNAEINAKGTLGISDFDDLVSYFVSELYGTKDRLVMSSYLFPNGYTLADFYNDVYNDFFEMEPDRLGQYLQQSYISMATSALERSKKGQGRNGYALQDETALNAPFNNRTMNILPRIPGNADNSEMLLYAQLLKAKEDVAKRLETVSDPQIRAHYMLLQYKINQALK